MCSSRFLDQGHVLYMVCRTCRKSKHVQLFAIQDFKYGTLDFSTQTSAIHAINPISIRKFTSGTKKKNVLTGK